MAPSIDIQPPVSTFKSSKASSVHPFAPLSSSEIKRAAELIRGEWPSATEFQFKVIMLEEPPKADVIPVLEVEARGETFAPLDRMAFINYYIRNTVSMFFR